MPTLRSSLRSISATALGAAAFALLPLATGCQESEAPKDAPAAEAAPEAPAPAAGAPCVGPVTTGTPQTITAGGKTWKRDGSTLTLEDGGEGPIVIGAITDIKESSPENLENIGAILKWFQSQQAALVIVAGDTGATREEIQAALEALAAGGIPIFNIIGNREGVPGYREAMAAVSAKHPHLFDLSVIRRVDLPQVDIISLPGYHDRNYVHADDGCTYTPADAEALADLVAASNSPVLLVSHGGPQQEGPEALDRTAEGENVGDPTLAAVMKKVAIPFGVFGNIHEAGGRATDLAGSAVLPQGALHERLYLNPGPADAVRWMMNDGTESLGMAAVIRIEGTKASYTIHRMGGQAADPDGVEAGAGAPGAKGKGAKGKKGKGAKGKGKRG